MKSFVTYVRGGSSISNLLKTHATASRQKKGRGGSTEANLLEPQPRRERASCCVGFSQQGQNWLQVGSNQLQETANEVQKESNQLQHGQNWLHVGSNQLQERGSTSQCLLVL